ncbi:CHAT domain-containing protein, partial [Tessaracoccus caeni]|uniref:CHAT domain-containing protein n=1 Tax=Tessaracoccus caeni TaxID=3031239 RepID=UPI0023DB2C30
VAVTISRQLAETNPAAFLPNLAMSLNNQAKQRSEAGDRAGALEAIDEAVTIRRQLAETNPAAFLPNLAMSLNNQATMRSEVGDLTAALQTIDETVTNYRQLAETNPAAFLPNLAGSLINQAAIRSEVGDRTAALQTIDEAITHYRQLAETNPAAFLPNLAGSLNNQANQRAEVGDRAGALEAIDEAVTIRRQLVETNPAAFLPDLAMSLNNQATIRSEVGDRTAALQTIDEAITHYRQLAETNPAAFLPYLAASLNNQANQRADAEGIPTASRVFAEGWDGLSPASRARLLMARVRWSLAREDANETSSLIVEDCASAATLVAEESEDPRPIGEARRELIGVVATVLEQRPDLAERLTTALPPWILTPVPDAFVDVCNRWLHCASWAERELFLEQHLDRLSGPEERTLLGTLRIQHPEVEGLGLLETLLDEIEKHGADNVLPQARGHFTREEELTAWLSTGTWRESERFLAQHRHLLEDRDAREWFAQYGDDPLFRQHYGLLSLSAAIGIERAYVAREDADTAADLGNELVEKRDWEALHSLLLAAPVLRERPFNAAYLLLVFDAIASNQAEDWAPDAALLEQARRHATPLQAKAAVRRLRILLRDHPDLPLSLVALADALTPPAGPDADVTAE